MNRSENGKSAVGASHSIAKPSNQDQGELAELDAKINSLLPEQYQHCYEAVTPVSMGTAALVFDPEGKVAWDRICDPPAIARSREP